jgi:hypothetical protein
MSKMKRCATSGAGASVTCSLAAPPLRREKDGEVGGLVSGNPLRAVVKSRLSHEHPKDPNHWEQPHCDDHEYEKPIVFHKKPTCWVAVSSKNQSHRRSRSNQLRYLLFVKLLEHALDVDHPRLAAIRLSEHLQRPEASSPSARMNGGTTNSLTSKHAITEMRPTRCLVLATKSLPRVQAVLEADGTLVAQPPIRGNS